VIGVVTGQVEFDRRAPVDDNFTGREGESLCGDANDFDVLRQRRGRRNRDDERGNQHLHG
jgi:hypothetical protein